MIPDPNDGNRPSHLTLARFATGELSAGEAAEVEQYVAAHPEARAHLDAIEAARSEVRPFDLAALRARAATVPGEAGATPAPANDNRGFYALVPVLLLAAVALLAAWPVLMGGPADRAVDPTYTGIRGTGALEVYHLEAEGLSRYDHRALGEGDVVGFKVDPAQHAGVVLLSVDGSGQVSVYWPASGDAPEPLAGSGMVALPGTVVLDGAPGPEIFVAVFDTSVADARADAERAWQAGGANGLRDWAKAKSEVDLAVVNRK
ncbi:MAG: hypothetical protein H6737_30845 [Alphaproteobacteria bacterium]|nr:hypothetical protein [Alphaproteobacteria bacterium]